MLYEAAAIDGAGTRQQFLRITLPLLRPVLVLVLTITLIASANLFAQPFIMTAGGPLQRTESIIFRIYVEGIAAQPDGERRGDVHGRRGTAADPHVHQLPTVRTKGADMTEATASTDDPRRERARRRQPRLPAVPVRAPGPVRTVLRAAAALDGDDRVQAVRRVAQPELDTAWRPTLENFTSVFQDPTMPVCALVLQQPVHRLDLHRAGRDHRLDGGICLRPDGVPRPQPAVRTAAGHAGDAGDHVRDPQLPHHRPPRLARHLPGGDRPRAVGSLRRVLPAPVLPEPPHGARRRPPSSTAPTRGRPSPRWCSRSPAVPSPRSQ